MRENLNERNGMILSEGTKTVAACRLTKGNGDVGDFVIFGVSYCNPKDKFNRKYGEWLALLKWERNADFPRQSSVRMAEGEDLESFIMRVFFYDVSPINVFQSFPKLKPEPKDCTFSSNNNY